MKKKALDIRSTSVVVRTEFGPHKTVPDRSLDRSSHSKGIPSMDRRTRFRDLAEFAGHSCSGRSITIGCSASSAKVSADV